MYFVMPCPSAGEELVSMVLGMEREVMIQRFGLSEAHEQKGLTVVQW